MKHIKEKEAQREHVGQVRCPHRHHHQTRAKTKSATVAHRSRSGNPPGSLLLLLFRGKQHFLPV